MKSRIIIISKVKLLIMLLIVAALLLFIFALRTISINTLHYYDPIYKGLEEEKKIAFACNVVWGEEYLPEMLKLFKEKDIEITFFIGGRWAEKNEELLKDIYKDEHELGNHGYKHLYHSKLTPELNKQEITKTEEIIKRITGCKTVLFAPPYGDINDTVVTSAETLGYKVIMWSIDTIDWNTKDYRKILQRLENKHHNGAIVLMHPTKVTIDALPQMIENLNKHGYEITTVSEVLEND
ncbi:MAG: polysaccharide deacetylase family protein [Clostridiaceae bacterium]|nr:polysaccharide deacetylase family protein [Clostridiaceae bacterium]